MNQENEENSNEIQIPQEFLDPDEIYISYPIEECDDNYHKLIQTFILLSGFLFFPLWLGGIPFIFHNNKTVFRLALLSTILLAVYLFGFFHLYTSHSEMLNEYHMKLFLF